MCVCIWKCFLDGACRPVDVFAKFMFLTFLTCVSLQCYEHNLLEVRHGWMYVLRGC